jgi:ankyrin repeat protein
MKIDRSRLVGYPEQLAIYNGDIVGLQGLLVNDDGAANRPHHDWLTPLVVAIALNRPDMVELLIEAGADTDCIVPLSLIDNLDSRAAHPPWSACARANPSPCGTLLGRACDETTDRCRAKH